MIRLIYISSAWLLMMTLFACKADINRPMDNDKSAPGPISNATVKNLPGAASITYTLPTDPDLLYIKAQYITKQGLVREVKSTYYSNSLTVVGFGDTSSYEVKLYAVDKGENSSVPISVTVNPLKPSYLSIRDSIKVSENFGGIDVEFKNKAKDDVAIVILGFDSLGKFVPINTYYTNLTNGVIRTRDLAAVKAKYGVYIRDRWDNRSDTLLVELTPLFETRLDRLKMKPLILANDALLCPGCTVAALFDGEWAYNWGAQNYQSAPESVMPQWFTYDMGVSAKLSRMLWYMRQAWYFDLHGPKEVEIWGSNNPSLDGNWDNWVLLAKHKQVKPSGLPNGQLSQADVDAAEAGETVIFPVSAPAVRYIRFKTINNWSGGNMVNFNEISMWGKPE